LTSLSEIFERGALRRRVDRNRDLSSLIPLPGESVGLAQMSTGYVTEDLAVTRTRMAEFDTLDPSWNAIKDFGETLDFDEAERDGIIVKRPCILAVQFGLYADDSVGSDAFVAHLVWDGAYSEIAGFAASGVAGYINDTRMVLAAPPAGSEFPVKLQVRAWAEGAAEAGPRDSWLTLTALVLSISG
jgi:hypothetical protein